MVFPLRKTPLTLTATLCALLVGCDDGNEAAPPVAVAEPATAEVAPPTTPPAPRPASIEEWVTIPGGEFVMGGSESDPFARPDEFPQHRVRINGFEMKATEVTNAEFREFVEATGYVTTAEQAIDWEEISKTLPPGTPKPPAETLAPGSLVFTPPQGQATNWYSWWSWTNGADWRHPQGPGSSIEGKDDHPVVQVSWDDAVAYAKWAGGRLPTEAEWEWAARGGLEAQPFTWGDEPIEAGAPKANTWQGEFPKENTERDGFKGSAPVASFAPNAYGLHDMAGNVWEWTSDWYRPDTYANAIVATNGEVVVNPQGPSDSFDPDEPGTAKRVTRGGSFLCHDSYCASYRTSARMKSSPDTSLNHTGFRIVRELEQQ